MEDRDFLIWLHERLEHVHGEDPLVDYMHKLRAIIYSTEGDRVSPSTCIHNSMTSLQEAI